MNRLGAFSFDAKGSPCFHQDCDDLEALCLALNEGVTGGPYTALPAWAGEMPPECNTEAERRAYAFGWFKALEAQRNGGAA